MDILKALSTAQKRSIKKAVEKQLSLYRFYKTTVFIGREASITASYDPRFHGQTNTTSDQTASAAIHNADEQQRRAAFCERMELAIERLPSMEKFLIQGRYTSSDSQYMSDMKMYSFEFDPPISHVTFNKIRISAMVKLALFMDIDCGVDLLSILHR